MLNTNFSKGKVVESFKEKHRDLLLHHTKLINS